MGPALIELSSSLEPDTTVHSPLLGVPGGRMATISILMNAYGHNFAKRGNGNAD